MSLVKYVHKPTETTYVPKQRPDLGSAWPKTQLLFDHSDEFDLFFTFFTIELSARLQEGQLPVSYHSERVIVATGKHPRPLLHYKLTIRFVTKSLVNVFPYSPNCHLNNIIK